MNLHMKHFNLTILGLLLISSCFSISCQDNDDINSPPQNDAPSSSTSSSTTQASAKIQTQSTTPPTITTTTITAAPLSPTTNSVPDRPSKKNKGRSPLFSGAFSADASPNAASKQAPCPQACQCNENRTEVICVNADLTSVPTALRSFTNLTHLCLRNNSFDVFPLQTIPWDSLITLDLSSNQIRNITSNRSKMPAKLVNLNLSSNRLVSPENLKNFNLTVMQHLDLSDNKLVRFDQLALTNLQSLNLSRNSIGQLGDGAFANMTKLNTLVLDGALKPAAVARLLNNGKIFDSNVALTRLDLSNLELSEVPISARNIANLSILILDRNRFTSLRPSDFRGLTNLTQVHIRQCSQLTRVDPFTFGDMKTLQILNLSHNPKLSDFSINALINSENYNSQENYTSIDFEEIDLSYNNLSSLPNLLEAAPKIVINELKLNNNPWQCDCAIMWIQGIPMGKMSTLHCAMPESRKDLEIHAIQFEECRQPHGPGSHGSYSFLLTCIVLLLFAFVIAFILRKSQFCRRLLWRDQYGTIYYTKASFPAETA